MLDIENKVAVATILNMNTPKGRSFNWKNNGAANQIINALQYIVDCDNDDSSTNKISELESTEDRILSYKKEVKSSDPIQLIQGNIFKTIIDGYNKENSSEESNSVPSSDVRGMTNRYDMHNLDDDMFDNITFEQNSYYSPNNANLNEQEQLRNEGGNNNALINARSRSPLK